jgi:hypothetical protein
LKERRGKFFAFLGQDGFLFCRYLKEKYLFVRNLLLFVFCRFLSVPVLMKIDTQLLSLMKKNFSKAEIEKVIAHYRKTGDHEKVRAAKYLAENMDDKYSLYGNILSDYFAIYDSVNNLYLSGLTDNKILDSIAGKCIDSLKAYKGSISSNDLERKKDILVIKSDSLIKSIDLAFDVWRHKPWASHVDFNQFCEFILATFFET